MLTEKEFRDLLAYTSRSPVLSLYLDTEPALGNADAYRLQMRNMLKGISGRSDAERIEQFFLHEYDWSGRSIAVFSCMEEGFFRAFPLALPVQSLVRWEPQLYLKPLADLWNAYGGYGVAVVDKQGLRLFHFSLGSMEEQPGYIGEEVKHVKKGGASALPGRRGGTSGTTGYEDELEHRNMKESAVFAARYFESAKVQRILLGGTEENTASFSQHLPKPMQSLVLATFRCSITDNLVDIQEKALQAGSSVEKARKAALVDSAITAAAKGAAGTTGLSKTLAAIGKHRVQDLLVSNGLTASGARCLECGELSATRRVACRSCGSKMEPVADIVDTAVITVLQDGGQVDIVHDSPELDQAGRIAALLRY